MAKRRRERDRPKSAHDALYNPNKRVLLSYASDDEDEGLERPAATGFLESLNAVTAGYTIDEYPDEECTEARSSLRLSEKEEEEYQEDEEEEELDEEDQAENDDSLWSRGVCRNNFTGQWPALGSLSYQWEDKEGEDDEIDTEEEEAMAYLRAVRSERQAMPTVFNAPGQDTNGEIYESGIGDSRGYLEDGAYIAKPLLGPSQLDTAKKKIDPQEAFTTAIRERFLKQREQMHISPGDSTLSKLDDKHPVLFVTKSTKAYAEWLRLLRTTTPLPAQVRAFDQETVLRLLNLIQKHFMVREKDIHKHVSVWVWSLLARLKDVGTMDHEQVFPIRELGKRAILVQLSFHSPVAAEQLERTTVHENSVVDVSPTQGKEGESQDGSYGEPALTDCDSDTADSAVEVAKGSIKDRASAMSSTRQNTLATLDAILVIVGEIFRQRDLLEFRHSWNVEKVA